MKTEKKMRVRNMHDFQQGNITSAEGVIMSEIFIGKLSYVIAAIYEVLLIYMFLKDFLGNKTQKWEKSLAFVFFFIFSTFINMYVPIPFITLLYDFIGIFALSFFFDGDWKTKVFASVLFIAFLIASEIMTLLSIMMLGSMSADTALGESTNRLLGVIISKTLLLVIVKIACAVRQKSYVKIPLMYLSLIHIYSSGIWIPFGKRRICSFV